MFRSIAAVAYQGDMFAAVHDKTFVDLGSAEGKCVISAMLHFSGLDSSKGTCSPKLRKSIGIELSTYRHDLALKHRSRIADVDLRERVQLVQDDILSPETARTLGEADVVYAANLHFPEELNRRLGTHMAMALHPARECFVLTLAPLHFGEKVPAAVWDVSVPM